ncbi:MAG: hypothetical protein IJO98_03145 [Clostridia bacterium]|nr:hypothetical protein [Clostridia bacterium]
MPPKAKKTASRRAPKRRKPGFRAGIAAAALIALGLGAMHLQAKVVHVRSAEVVIDDLPEAFDGTRVLFASDFDFTSSADARQAERLFRKLQSLRPDILLLGGDYASPSLLERLNGSTGSEETAARKTFFSALEHFDAPMGKFAVSGDEDGPADALELSMFNSGVQLIDGELARIEKDGEAIGVVGVGPQTRVSDLSRHIAGGRCVIALMHSPSRAVDVRISEAGDGGEWADLLLAGHTHGGQMKIGPVTALDLDANEKRYLSGWFTDAAPLLVTQGVGCEGVKLRLGTEAEVWLLTLRGE